MSKSKSAFIEEYLDEEFDTLLNPTVIIEVLSPTTEKYDRGTKFKLYRSIPSLQNYIMISSTDFSAEVYTKMKDDKWNLKVTKEKEGAIHISALDFDLPLNDVYAQVVFFAIKFISFFSTKDFSIFQSTNNHFFIIFIPND